MVLEEKTEESKFIFLHNFNQKDMAILLRLIKKQFHNYDIAFSCSTEKNQNFQVKELIADVLQDHEYLKNNPPNINKPSQ